jgi:short-subunit dehydrogenase
MEVDGRVFVVTGGGNGIGREVVLTLLERGGRVAAVDLSAAGLAETARLAGSVGDRLTVHTVDITDRSAVEALPATVLAAHGTVDGLVDVAGIIQRFVPFGDLDVTDIEKVMNVNFYGTVWMVRAFLPHLRARPEACVVNVSSMGGLAPVPGQTLYGASKAAVKLFTEGLYAELRGSTVRVSVVFPGGVSTHIADNSGVTVPNAADVDPDSVPTTTAQAAARQIVDEGVEKGRYRVVIGKDARMIDGLSRLAPRRATDTIAKRMAALLGPAG